MSSALGCKCMSHSGVSKPVAFHSLTGGTPVPEVVEEEASLPASVSVALVGRPHSALAQAEQAPVQDEQQGDDAQPECSPPHP